MSIPNIGHIVGQYKITQLLGEGSFGTVYKAQDVDNNEVYALKFLKTWSIPPHARQNLERRFELEFETGLIHSQNLVRTHTINRYGDIPYIVMDYCGNGNLQKKINKPLSTTQSMIYAKGILDGLADLHQAGKIHRDLKPENILFDLDDTPRLTDFGITGHINMQLTVVNHEDKPDSIFGSYAYMAPEQITAVKRQNTILPTVDIFSFGVVCYEMFSGGRLPFGKWEVQSDIGPYLSRAACNDCVTIQSYNQQLPIKWSQMIHRCLHASREKRFQNIEEIHEALDLTPINEKMSLNYLKLQVMDGETIGRIYSSESSNTKKIFTLGRETVDVPQDIPIAEQMSNYISRRHATIEQHSDNYFIRDGQWVSSDRMWKYSKNGTYVNGIKLEENSAHLLQLHDVVIVGNTSLKVIS